MADQKDFKIVEFVKISKTQKGDKLVGETTDGKKFYWTIIAKNGTVREVPPLNVKLSILASETNYNGVKMEWMNWFALADKQETPAPTPAIKPVSQPQPAATIPPEQPKTAIPAPKPAIGGKYTTQELEGFKMRDKQIMRSTALNNSVQMVLALSHILKFNGMNDGEIKLYMDAERKRYKAEFMKFLQGDISTGTIELAEEVGGVPEEEVPF